MLPRCFLGVVGLWMVMLWLKKKKHETKVLNNRDYKRKAAVSPGL